MYSLTIKLCSVYSLTVKLCSVYSLTVSCVVCILSLLAVYSQGRRASVAMTAGALPTNEPCSRRTSCASKPSSDKLSKRRMSSSS